MNEPSAKPCEHATVLLKGGYVQCVDCGERLTCEAQPDGTWKHRAVFGSEQRAVCAACGATAP